MRQVWAPVGLAAAYRAPPPAVRYGQRCELPGLFPELGLLTAEGQLLGVG